MVWESAAILRHLARKHGTPPFWPDDLAGQARVDQWAEWAKVNIATSFTVPVFWRVVRTAPSKRDPDAIRAGLVWLDRFLDIAEQQLAGSAHLAREAFTLADIQFGHVLFRYFDIDIPRKPRPSLDRYYAALTGRPAYREHVMVSYDALRVPD